MLRPEKGCESAQTHEHNKNRDKCACIKLVGHGFFQGTCAQPNKNDRWLMIPELLLHTHVHAHHPHASAARQPPPWDDGPRTEA